MRAVARAVSSGMAMAALVVLTGCRFDEHGNPSHCAHGNVCPMDHVCRDGFCVPSKDGGESISNVIGAGGANQSPAATGDATSASGGVKGGDASGSTPVAHGSGGASGVSSQANGSAPGGKAASATGGTSAGGTSAGGTSTGGMNMSMNPSCEPSAELCDGHDDDCDGTVDEDSDEACYPDGVDGCKLSGNAWTCSGVCGLGTRACHGGKLDACAGAITPAASDPCTTTGTATDDDCDGKIDEDCVCKEGSTQSCYQGPSGTEGKGPCVHGTQTCSGNKLGPCTGSVMPQPETCANEGSDDDCNGTKDDVPMRSAPCSVSANQGVCRSGTLECQAGSLVCSTPAPSAHEGACDGRDDDCDGKTDEDFDLQNDVANCGSCGNACGGGQSCCGGACADTQSDTNHCGASCAACGAGFDCCGGQCVNVQNDVKRCGSCTNACSSGESCCGGQCANLQSDAAHCSSCASSCNAGESCCSGNCKNLKTDNENCGSCGRNCGLVSLTCTCDGTGTCRSDLLNICL